MKGQTGCAISNARADIPLQPRTVLRTLGLMRFVIAFAVWLCMGVAISMAQEQEGKLMDRLLRPDMSLQNAAQTKQFSTGGAAPAKAARTKTFHFAQRARTRSYTGVRNFDSAEFQTRTSPDRNRPSTIPQRQAPETASRFTTASYSRVHAAPDAQKTAASSAFGERHRSFLVRGKSQKALSAQDRPLTLDEVRELLNKNK